MAIPFSNTHHRIPRGFGNLLEGLTREVLREQPKDIPDFAAKYFAELLKKREETNFDPAEWGAKLEDRFYNNYSFNEQKTSVSDLTKNKASIIIQAAYRGHLGRKQVRKIKAAQKGYLDVPSDFAEFTSVPDDTYTVHDEKSKEIPEVDPDVSVGRRSVDLYPTEPDMPGIELVKGDKENVQFAVEPQLHIDKGQGVDAFQVAETQLEQALYEQGFTVEEPEELETSSTLRDELSDDGEIYITVQETQLHTETFEKQDGSFSAEKAYIVEEESAESSKQESSTPVNPQEVENAAAEISQEEPSSMEGYSETSEEGPL
ncbi:uncharacterized protein LOC115074007 [Rhinatrema bivittatum]|uniref:uncharacterized protein LOC115074007 n=1 Tax=Rhinatrema bivittatum TaxID=194408 RepID=UPI00112B5BCD|nr:uncharacterized protein LOC115074007 [Rhinatrema bivittatum]